MPHILPKFNFHHMRQPPQPRSTSTVAPEIETSESLAHPPVSLLQPSKKRRARSNRLLRIFRSAFQSLPIIVQPPCKLPSVHGRRSLRDRHLQGSLRMTGTLFGRRKARISLAIQDNSMCFPMLLMELAIPTAKLLQEMASGMVRIALECEKEPAGEGGGGGGRTELLDEPVWTMFCNGKKTGYGTKREPMGEDVSIMQLLHAVSMGAGVLPDREESTDGEMTYMRAHFDRVIGSRDSETFYMLNPDGNSGPELTIFFVRI